MPDTDKSVITPVLGALAAAAAVLVFFVLPAEHGIDPTGIGGALGLAKMAEEPSHALTLSDTAPVSDSVSFTLQPFESIEYKYRLADEAGMTYAWNASGPLAFDFHAEPDGAEEGFAETFSDGKAAQEAGTYVAPFPGIHGWYWQNRNGEPVTVTLTASGFMQGATVYRDGFVENITIE